MHNYEISRNLMLTLPSKWCPVSRKWQLSHGCTTITFWYRETIITINEVNLFLGLVTTDFSFRSQLPNITLAAEWGLSS